MTFIKPALIARQHDTTHSPLGLWQLNGNLNDASGNGYNLTVETGVERYTRLPGGNQGFLFDGVSSLIYNVAEAALRLLGDMTFEVLVEWLDAPPGIAPNNNKVVVSHEGASETEANNALYKISTGSTTPSFAYVAEHSAGVNIIHTTVDGAPQGLQHLTLVRSSNDVTFFVNGGAIETTSSGLLAPTGGSGGRFRLGPSGEPTCVMSSAKLIGSALTAQQVADEYGRTLG